MKVKYVNLLHAKLNILASLGSSVGQIKPYLVPKVGDRFSREESKFIYDGYAVLLLRVLKKDELFHVRQKTPKK